jgi:hypothetical protein
MEILKIIALALAILLLVVWLTSFSDQCEIPTTDTTHITRDCLESQALYNCGNANERNPHIIKKCSDLSLCLKDPLAYQERKEEEEWN